MTTPTRVNLSKWEDGVKKDYVLKSRYGVVLTISGKCIVGGFRLFFCKRRNKEFVLKMIAFGNLELSVEIFEACSFRLVFVHY